MPSKPKPVTDPIKERAYHEAGHALLARLLGMTVTEATIEPDEDSTAHLYYEGILNGVNANHIPAIISRGGKLGVSYSGLETHYNGNFDGDREQAAEYDEACTCKPTLAERVVVHNAEAEELIKSHEIELINLATVLYEQGTLLGNEEVDAAIQGKAVSNV